MLSLLLRALKCATSPLEWIDFAHPDENDELSST
jgi:hypothetical protein